MSLNIEDGFNFALGEWIADALLTVLGLIAVFVFVAVFYLIVAVYERITDRRFRK